MSWKKEKRNIIRTLRRIGVPAPARFIIAEGLAKYKAPWEIVEKLEQAGLEEFAHNEPIDSEYDRLVVKDKQGRRWALVGEPADVRGWIPEEKLEVAVKVWLTKEELRKLDRIARERGETAESLLAKVAKELIAESRTKHTTREREKFSGPER